MDEKIVKLDGEEITMEQLNEKKRNLPQGYKIVETSPNYFILLEKLNG